MLNLTLVFLFLYFWPEWGELFGIRYERRYQVVYYMIAIATAAAFRYLVLLADGVWSYRNLPQGDEAVPPLSRMFGYYRTVGISGRSRGVQRAVRHPHHQRVLWG